MPVPEPSDVEKCSHLNFDELRAEGNRLTKELKSIRDASESVIKDSDPEHLEPFKSKMGAILEKSEAALKELLDLIEECARKFVRTMAFYQFRPKEASRLEDAQPKVIILSLNY